MIFYHFGFLALALQIFISGCKIERPDPVSTAAAIFHKRPSNFLNQLTALNALASAEAGMPVTSWMEILYHQSARLKPQLAAAITDSARVALLNSWVFDTLGMVAVPDANDLQTSLPSQVLEKQKGSCLGLSLVYLALGQYLDLPLFPVLLPGHIFIRFRSKTYTCNIETLRRGLARTDTFYYETFFLDKRPWYQLKEGEPKQALSALLFNLGNLHRIAGHSKFALGEYQLVLETLPGYPEALGNEGATLMAAGELAAAENSFLASLKGDSLGQAAKKNLANIYNMTGDTAKAALFTER